MRQRDNAAMNDVEISPRQENCDVTASVAALDGVGTENQLQPHVLMMKPTKDGV